MNDTKLVEALLVAVIFAVLLGVEWRYQRGGVRVATAMLSLVVLLLAQPDFTTAARHVSVAAPAERVTQRNGSRISEFESGVATMYEAIDDAGEVHAYLRLVALCVLFWLACSPVLRREHRP